MKSILSQSLFGLLILAYSATFASAEITKVEKQRLIDAQQKDFYAKYVTHAIGFCLAGLKNNGLNTQAVLNSGYKKRRKSYSKGFKVQEIGYDRPPLFNNRKVSVQYNKKTGACAVILVPELDRLNSIVPVVKKDMKHRGYSGGNAIKIDGSEGVLFAKGGQKFFFTGFTVRYNSVTSTNLVFRLK